MKKIFFVCALAAALLSSCGVNYALVANHNQNTTQVQLGSNNFKVVDRVMGSAEVEYVVMIGGFKKKHLYEKAYSDMITKANLLNSSKAITNVLTEEHFTFVTPFYVRRVITVSANVIEFTK